jgi:exosome complex RNA-binding protein Rrp42 (RNase PH superfamily)
MDPTDAEECVMDDKIILTLDEDNEMCTVFKLGHVPTSKLVFSECLALAKTQSQHIREKLDAISAK